MNEYFSILMSLSSINYRHLIAKSDIECIFGILISLSSINYHHLIGIEESPIKTSKTHHNHTFIIAEYIYIYEDILDDGMERKTDS